MKINYLMCMTKMVNAQENFEYHFKLTKHIQLSHIN